MYLTSSSSFANNDDDEEDYFHRPVQFSLPLPSVIYFDRPIMDVCAPQAIICNRSRIDIISGAARMQMMSLLSRHCYFQQAQPQGETMSSEILG